MIKIKEELITIVCKKCHGSFEHKRNKYGVKKYCDSCKKIADVENNKRGKNRYYELMAKNRKELRENTELNLIRRIFRKG